MKTFLEMIDLMKGRPQRGGLGHELNCVDYIQLSSGHWAGHNYPGDVYVSVEKYPRGSLPESGLSSFKYEPGRPATEEETKEYWGAWKGRMRSLPKPSDDWGYDEN